jgi:hypothetical protein
VTAGSLSVPEPSVDGRTNRAVNRLSPPTASPAFPSSSSGSDDAPPADCRSALTVIPVLDGLVPGQHRDAQQDDASGLCRIRCREPCPDRTGRERRKSSVATARLSGTGRHCDKIDAVPIAVGAPAIDPCHRRAAARAPAPVPPLRNIWWSSHNPPDRSLPVPLVLFRLARSDSWFPAGIVAVPRVRTTFPAVAAMATVPVRSGVGEACSARPARGLLDQVSLSRPDQSAPARFAARLSRSMMHG